MRGMAEDPRDPALGWVAQRAREAGGLVGDLGITWWPTALESALAALLAGLGVVLLWDRLRSASLACLLLAVASALAPPAARLIQSRTERVVVMRPAALTPEDGEPLQLEPGQVLVVRRAAGRELGVRAGREVEGQVDSEGVHPVREEPEPARR
jgi:hypothetical protein